MAGSSKKHDKSTENLSDSSMDLILPSTVLSTILSNLDVRSICSAAAASKLLSIAASNTLTFAGSFHIMDVAIRIDLLRQLLLLPKNLHVKSLKLDCARLDDMAIDILARPSLKEVHLHNCENFNGKLLFELGNTCHELRGLYMSSLAERRRKVLQLSDLESMLKGCSQLESLTLSFDISRLDDPNFPEAWSHASQTLTSLSIGYIPTPMLTQLLARVTPPPFFPSLQKLHLSLDIISDTTLEKISASLPSLTHLHLKDSPYVDPPHTSDLTNAGLQSLNPHKRLKHISLTRTQEFLVTHFRRVNDQGLLLMAQNCARLESITLGGFWKVTDAGFRELAHKCPDLRRLEIFQGSHVTDILFHDIALTPLALTHVSLRWCALLTDAAIRQLSLNTRLAVLDLRDCRKLRDESLRCISALAELRALYMDGTDVTDAGVSYLGSGACPLDTLSLRGCWNLTSACVENLLRGGLGGTLRRLDLSRVARLGKEGVFALARCRVPLVELRLRECAGVGMESVIALASTQMEGGGGGCLGSRLEVLDMYECGEMTPLAFRWFKKPYFPRLVWLGLTGSVNRDLVDAINVNRPLLRVKCRGEELGSGSWDEVSGWYGDDEDEEDELEQWICEDNGDVSD